MASLARRDKLIMVSQPPLRRLGQLDGAVNAGDHHLRADHCQNQTHDAGNDFDAVDADIATSS